MDDLSDVIALLSSGTYTVTRTPASVYTAGRLVPGVATTFTVLGSLQPLSGREVDRLPEGAREREGMALWTTTELRGKLQTSEPDTVTVDGEAYEVQNVQRWDTLGNYYRAVILRAASRG